MKILVIGVGGIGGFFGAHLHIIGEDVTFLVRELKKPIIQKSYLKQVLNSNDNDRIYVILILW